MAAVAAAAASRFRRDIGALIMIFSDALPIDQSYSRQDLFFEKKKQKTFES
jgi:hypothetical protein